MPSRPDAARSTQLRSNSVSLDEDRVQNPPSNTPVYLRRTNDVSKGRTVYRVIFPALLQAALAEDATPLYLLAKWVLEGDQIFVFEEEDIHRGMASQRARGRLPGVYLHQQAVHCFIRYQGGTSPMQGRVGGSSKSSLGASPS
jgi:hypothetical protein